MDREKAFKHLKTIIDETGKAVDHERKSHVAHAHTSRKKMMRAAKELLAALGHDATQSEVAMLCDYWPLVDTGNVAPRGSWDVANKEA